MRVGAAFGSRLRRDDGTAQAHAAHIAAVLMLAAAVACSEPQEPIVVEEGSVVVQNLTSDDWKKVVVVVNDHYTGGTPFLAAGGRLNAPLSQFQTGLGYKYDRGRMSVFKVEVTATDADGKPVKLLWGKDRPAQ
jgi:hypothetical protein